jgi:hypothetical protein
MKYLNIILVLLLLFIIGSTIKDKMSHSSANADRLPCHKERIVFEKIYNDELMKSAMDLLYSGRYTLTSRIQKATYMKTRLFEYVDIKKVDAVVKETIARYQKKDIKTDQRLEIDYYIYENDKADPGKKTAKSKLYAGYLRFTFSLSGKRVYSVQVDFMNPQGKDIPQSVECAIKSIMTL